MARTKQTQPIVEPVDEYATQTNHKKTLPQNCDEVPAGRVKCLKPDGSGGFRVMALAAGTVIVKRAWNVRPGEVCLVLE
jgi:hypothetical protein